jgi:hypothetical protein
MIARSIKSGARTKRILTVPSQEWQGNNIRQPMKMMMSNLNKNLLLILPHMPFSINFIISVEILQDMNVNNTFIWGVCHCHSPPGERMSVFYISFMITSGDDKLHTLVI